MGTVWLGRRDGVVVAVKMLLPAFAMDPYAVARFERELRILGALRTRHAVRLVSSGRRGGQPYAVMEHIDGANLADRLEAGARPEAELAVGIVRELLVALREIHAEGVVHRDVKPANIMVTDGEEGPAITLVDFGVASSRRELALVSDPDRVTVGTAPYMSPEQLVFGGAGSVHEDMWAAAVVGYECLLGRVPFEGPSYAGVYRARKGLVVMPPRSLYDDLPAPLDRWFARALAPKLNDRFSDAGEMAAAWEIAVRRAAPLLEATPFRTSTHERHATPSAARRAARDVLTG